ncbi:MAG: DUF998 domain-containing protein, partial [Candidatus Thermoplasmatota archaeon]|nr:DUF998 domain-containing protein [Candidatus Thermoplasmatota archaeon]MCL5440063.1 DUF998 domain-containing protein [Candidatus Thermoplasmatota archaeon]
MKNEHAAGVLIFAGTFIFSISLMIGEALYKNYSISGNVISDLGVGSTAYLFNGTIIFLGITLVLAGIILAMPQKKAIFPYLLIISGIGAMIVGLFPETTGSPHTIGAFLVFLFSGIAAIFGIKRFKSAFRFISPIIGLLVLVSIVLYAMSIDLGIG